MAKDKRKSQRTQRFLSILNPDNIDYSDDDAMTSDGRQYTNNELSQLGNSGGEGVNSRVREGINRSPDVDLARGQNVSPFEDSKDVTLSARRGTSKELLTDPNSNLVTPNLRVPATATSSRVNPLLFGNANIRNITSELFPNAGGATPDINSMQPMTPGNTIKGGTPEDRVMEAIMNTNPSPQSAWKRVLTGLGRGLRESAGDIAEGNYGGAFGKIASNVVLGAIPGVNSTTQYEQNKAHAIEKYKLEKMAEQGKLSREKTEADIRETNERLKLSQQQRQQQTQRDALLDAARLRDDKRAEADQRLKILEKLPANDPQRNELSRDLATLYQLRVSPQYGLNEKSGDQITIYDEQSGNYIRAQKDGTPITDQQGNNIVVRPGKQESLKQTKDKALQDVIAKHGGDAKSVARLSIENRKDEIINSLPKQYQDALRNPSSTNSMTYDDAKKAYDSAFNNALKQSEAFTEALYEREADEIMRTSRTTTGSKQAPTRQTTGESSKPAPGYFLKFR